MSKGWNGRPPAGRIAYVDGRYVRHGSAAVHVEDRGLQLGDAVYEVCGVDDGFLMDEDEHLDRLERSLREIEIALPMPRNALKLVMRELVRRNGVRNGLLYLQISRGVARRDHPIPKAAPRPSLILTARSVPPGEFEKRRQDGVTVISRPDERWGRRDIKTVQLLPNLLAKTAARRAGAYEAWLVDAAGFVTEGSSTNAWIVDAQGNLRTRPLSHAILPGVTRRVILEAAEAAQLPVVQEAFSLDETHTAREAFISSATGVMPVVAINGRPVGNGKPGPVTRRVQELYGLTSAGRAAKTGT
ncbi:MAG: D-amino-acid transaminase [Rhizomicrobium sp.]